MNEEPKKLNKYYILVLVLILIIGIISATYAFFQIDTDSSTANTTITANAECFNITFEDLSEEGINNLDINYPIKDEYALGKTEEVENLKPVIVKVSNKCTQIQDNLNYKLAITTLAKEPADEQDKGYIPDNKVRYNVDKALNEEAKSTLNGPEYLNNLSLVEDANVISLLKEEITNNKININEYDTVNTYIIDSDSLASNTYSTYYIKLWIDYYEGDSEAYTNPEGHVKGNEYDNSTEGQKFESVISLIADGTTSERPKSTIELLREKDPSETLSTELQGGMYRYQGIGDIPNWICFGTRSKDDCTNEETGIDKYMYRIIGITEEGQMYLIKETFVKEGSVTGFTWDDVYQISGTGGDSCENGKCPEWNEADLFQRINGTANGTRTGAGDFDDKKDDNSDIFVDSIQYDYLKSGDGANGTSSASEWYNLIADHEWLYGDTNDQSTANKYNGDAMYAIEHGDKETTHYVQNPEGSTTVEQQTYTWNQKIKAKISLMYVHDYYYGYYDGSTEESRGNAGSYSKLKDSWLFFRKDRYNTSPSYEWFSTRWGVYSTSNTNVSARYVSNNGTLNYNGNLNGVSGVRPVFYLESKAKIASGDGTKSSPFILE